MLNWHFNKFDVSALLYMLKIFEVRSYFKTILLLMLTLYGEVYFY